jgi:hypothetical protein
VTTSSNLDIKMSGQILYMEVGVIAFFGIIYEDIISPMAYKLASVSERVSALKFSKMGEDVPSKPTDPEKVGKKKWNDIAFGVRDRILMDKVFLIVYIETKSENNQDVFTYANVRADRLQSLLKLDLSKIGSYRLADYVTVILQKLGKPTIGDKERLQRDYLFENEAVNVRIFPPLAEVT